MRTSSNTLASGEYSDFVGSIIVLGLILPIVGWSNPENTEDSNSRKASPLGDVFSSAAAAVTHIAATINQGKFVEADEQQWNALLRPPTLPINWRHGDVVLLSKKALNETAKILLGAPRLHSPRN